MKKLLILLQTMMVINLQAQTLQADICVYGATSGGVMAAVAASRMGKSVILVEPSAHIGGLTTGGLGATDIGNKYAVTGLSRDFYRKLGTHYGSLEMWAFEPNVAEKLFYQYLKGTRVKLIKEHQLQAVKKNGKAIAQIKIEPVEGNDKKNALTIKATVFIDASYEGDLMAKAGVSYTVGREDNAVYKETINGVQLKTFHQFPDGIDPYIIPGNAASGLVYGVSARPLAPNGTGDDLVQAYNYRLCLSNNQQNFIPLAKPENYDPSKYELVKRLLVKRTALNWKHDLRSYLLINIMPNGKSDMNNMGPFSTDFIGENWNYAEANNSTRKQIAKEHELYIKGFLYFLGNDLSVPDTLRQQMKKWGYPKDEFTDNAGFPHQLYVREARRMKGEYVMTEHHCRGVEVVNDVVGMAAYTMDSHNCQRIVVNGMVKNEGDVQVGGFPPYPISYRSLIPKANECTNLLVPVCLSASHIAYGSIRMEPVFMVLGQSTAIAASLAIDQRKAVQQIDVQAIQNLLKKNPLLDGSIPEILIDNADTLQVSFAGNWQLRQEKMGQYKTDCMVLDNKDKLSSATFSFSTTAEKKAFYTVFIYTPYNRKNAVTWTNQVPVKIETTTQVLTSKIDFGKNYHEWVSLGELHLNAGEKISITINATGIEGAFAADAVLLIPQQAHSK